MALTLDATFFGRGYGLMVYRAEGRNIHWQEIESETIAVVEAGLKHLKEQGWKFSSVTVDGRKGTILYLLYLRFYHYRATPQREKIVFRG